ncbi:MAG: hypothetical protein FJZ95_04645, partial [Chloroflexi bacterium]|nr:hypothetical protein [Chloroflexota bacterium]
MKKAIALILILTLMVSVIGLVACGGDDENGEDEGKPTATKTSKPTAEEPDDEDADEAEEEEDGDEAGEPTSEADDDEEEEDTGSDDGVDEGIAKLFEKAPKCIQGEFVTSGPGMPEVEQKLWMKEKKMRMEATVEGQESISIADLEEGVIYTYMSQMGKWFRVEISAEEVAEMNMEAILDCDPQIVGSQSIDGKSCTIVEYHCAGVESKAWIWKDKGWPLRVETQSPKGTVVTVYKNLKFICADDSLFELPKGAEIMDMGEMIEGFEGMDDNSGGEMPDIDIDINELLKN